jgi:hypothetical protein
VEAGVSDSRTLSDQLADRVTKKLSDGGLLRQERLQSVASLISGGKMKPADWRQEIDLALAKGEKK